MAPTDDGGLPSRADLRVIITDLRRRVGSERARAARAAAIAAGYEAKAAASHPPEREQMRTLYVRMAALHRRMEERHLAAVAVQELHLERMRAWLTGERGPSFWPVFMAAIAALIGVGGATATVRRQRSADVLAVVASDPTARAAHDLEVTLGEGPAATVMAAGAPVRVSGQALAERWPLFGPAVAELGVRSVVAVPLYLPAAGYLGVLCGYDRAPNLADDVIVSAGRMADALTASVLLAPEVAGLLGAEEFQAVVHQAAGMLSVQCGCGTDDAEAMLRARGFADGRPVDEIARGVLRGEIRLC